MNTEKAVAIGQGSLSDDIVSSIILHGDLSGLAQNKQVEYIKSLCARLGVDPATQPFRLLTLKDGRGGQRVVPTWTGAGRSS